MNVAVEPGLFARDLPLLRVVREYLVGAGFVVYIGGGSHDGYVLNVLGVGETYLEVDADVGEVTVWRPTQPYVDIPLADPELFVKIVGILEGCRSESNSKEDRLEAV